MENKKKWKTSIVYAERHKTISFITGKEDRYSLHQSLFIDGEFYVVRLITRFPQNFITTVYVDKIER